MNWNDYKKWLAIGSGVGIEIDGQDLVIVLVRVRPSGARVLKVLRIERYTARPAAEWGAEYSNFLQGLGGGHLSATVLLPRNDVIVRQIAMAGVGRADLAAAVRFQIDGLHPYGEDEAVYDFARIGNSGNVLIGITRREVINRFVTIFVEAGIKVACFSFSAAVLHGALRLFGTAPARGFLALHQRDGELEAYGESEARPVFSASFEAHNEHFASRARSLALSELRLEPDTEPVAIEQILPAPVASAGGAAPEPLAYATALVAACPRLTLGANLLPPEFRVTSSRSMYIPSIVLGALLVIGLGALWIYSAYEDRRYARALETEIRRVDPIARKPMALDRSIVIARQRAGLLDSFRARTQADLDALNELTHLLPAPGWLTALEMSRDQIRLTGEASDAAGLLRVLDKSPLFEGSDFALPLARSQGGEMFSIRSHREGVLP